MADPGKLIQKFFRNFSFPGHETLLLENPSNKGLNSNKILAEMAFILGVGFKISDTRGPIWMKLWGYLESTLRLCNVVFSTSGLVLKTGNYNFPENPTIIPCNIFLGFLIFPNLKHSQIDSKSFRMPQA